MRTIPAEYVKIDPAAYILGALLLLTLPLKWLFAALIAAICHEICHIFVIKLLGGHIWGIRIGVAGAVMETEPLSQGKELLSTMAGPMGSLLLLLFCRWIPRIAICAGIQALFNLLPLFPLDGGRILRCGAELLLPKKWADFLCPFLESTTLLAIAVFAVIGVFWYHLGFMPLIVTLMLLIKAASRKIPCKEVKLRVQ